jgi:hypothetical protein
MQTLHLYDSSDRAIRRWGYVGIDQPGIVYTGVSGYQDIENEIRRVGGLGGKIGELWIHSHGAPGVIVIPLSGWFSGALCLDANNVGQLATVCRMFIATPGKVFFTGCSVGEGAPGDAFLRAAGPAMLGHGGGVVLASTSVTASVPWYGEWLPPWGHVKAAKVSPGGAVVISTSGFTTKLPSLPSLPSLPRAPMPVHIR